MMRRTILILIGAATLILSVSPMHVMAAGKAKGKPQRPEVQQLRKERQALRSEVQAARAKGAISPEDKAKFQSERQRLKKEADALKLNQNRKQRARDRGRAPAASAAPSAL